MTQPLPIELLRSAKSLDELHEIISRHPASSIWNDRMEHFMVYTLASFVQFATKLPISRNAFNEIVAVDYSDPDQKVLASPEADILLSALKEIGVLSELDSERYLIDPELQLNIQKLIDNQEE